MSIGNKEESQLPEKEAKEVTWGTHTIPKKFWTSGKPPLLKDEGFLKRRAAKRARHEQNKTEKASRNQNKRGK